MNAGARLDLFVKEPLSWNFFVEFKRVDTGTFLGSSQSTGCKYRQLKAGSSSLSVQRFGYKRNLITVTCNKHELNPR